jgi:hypothetical protein
VVVVVISAGLDSVDLSKSGWWEIFVEKKNSAKIYRLRGTNGMV